MELGQFFDAVVVVYRKLSSSRYIYSLPLLYFTIRTVRTWAKTERAMYLETYRYAAQLVIGDDPKADVLSQSHE